jgi:hypothetical protein
MTCMPERDVVRVVLLPVVPAVTTVTTIEPVALVLARPLPPTLHRRTRHHPRHHPFPPVAPDKLVLLLLVERQRTTKIHGNRKDLDRLPMDAAVAEDDGREVQLPPQIHPHPHVRHPIPHPPIPIPNHHHHHDKSHHGDRRLRNRRRHGRPHHRNLNRHRRPPLVAAVVVVAVVVLSLLIDEPPAMTEPWLTIKNDFENSKYKKNSTSSKRKWATRLLLIDFTNYTMPILVANSLSR